MRYPHDMLSHLLSLFILTMALLSSLVLLPGLACAEGGTLSLPKVAVSPGDSITISLTLALDQESMYAADLLLSYDSTVISAVSVEKGDLVSDWIIGSNLGTNGTIQIGLAGAEPVTAGGELLRLTFQAIGNDGDTSSISLIQGDLNEGQIETVLDDGSITLVERIEGLSAANSSPTMLQSSTIFTASISSGSDASYLWDFGDDSTGSTDQNPTHTYAAVGTYTATVTATNSVSSQTDTTVVTVIDRPISGLTAANDSPTELNESTHFQAVIVDGSNATYAWDFGDDSTGSTAQNPDYTYVAVGTYTATVTATNSVGSQTATTVVAVVDRPIDGLSAANDSPTLLDETTSFTATISDGSNVSYAWDFGDDATSTDRNPTHTYAAVGTYTTTVTATNSVSSQTDTTMVTVVDRPISGLTAANDGPTLLDETTSFTATISDGSNVSYAWDFGDDATSSEQNPTHTYAAVGTYTATVTATNSVSSQTDTTVVTVVDRPISGLTAANDGPTLLDETTSFTATISDGSNVSYAWDFGDDATSSEQNPTHTYAAVGTYTATVTATNSVSSQTDTTVVTVVDRPISGLTATNDSPTQLDAPTYFVASISDGSNVSYQWDFGDDATSSEQNPTHTYAAVGTYTATVTATNSISSQTDTTLVIVTDRPISGLTAANDSPTLLDEVTSFTATISDGSNVTYAWNFGDDATGTDQNPTHTYAAVGTYTATVTATNSVGSQTDTTVVTVVDRPISGMAASNDSPTLLDEVTSFTATISDGSNATYAWDFGDGGSSTDQNPVHTYAAVGTYIATVTATNSVSSQTDTTLAIVIDRPISGLTATNDSPTQLDAPTHFAASITDGSNVFYQWDFGDDTISSEQNPIHTYAAVGTYTATVTATNSVGQHTGTTDVVIADRIVTIHSTKGNTLVYTSTQVITTTITIPPSAVTEEIVLVFTKYHTVTHPIDLLFANHAFDLTAYRGSVPLSTFVFEVPITVTLNYTDTDVESLKEDELTLHYWDGDSWIDAATTCNPESSYSRHPNGNWLSLPICHLTYFALFGPADQGQENKVYLPFIVKDN